MARHLLVLGGLWLALAGCEGAVDRDPQPCDLTYELLRGLRINQVYRPSPVIIGSQLRLRGEGFLSEPSCVTSEVVLIGSDQEVSLAAEVRSTNEVVATVGAEAAEALGLGSFEGAIALRYRAVDGPLTFESRVRVEFPLVSLVSPSAFAIVGDQVYLNEEVEVRGEGFIGGDEGLTEVELEGAFTPLEGEVVPLEPLILPGWLLRSDDRTKLGFLWSPAVGGLRSGRFEGTLRPLNTHASGEQQVVRGERIPIEVEQRESVLYSVSPEAVSLGEYVDLVGRGFLGNPAFPEEVTAVRLNGFFTPAGGRPEAISLELYGDWVSGNLLRWPVTVTSGGDYLRSVDFDVHAGLFAGTALPILTLGTERLEGVGIDLVLELTGVRQVCWVRFLPGFSGSVALLGLSAVEDELRRRIIAKIQAFYRPPDRPGDWINVEFRDEEPQDFYSGGYALLDIGGPDPNGLGLLGYDSAPNKDVGNLRLHDHVGGENALGDVDGFGYGGVFIESFLFWSEHPPFDERPPAAPEPEPLFDDVFDSVRFNEVVADEWPSGSEASRIAEIELALEALSAMVADTAAHEFGHSLGLAQPYGGRRDFHNTVPRDGCLMDAGMYRPFVERTRLYGNPGARFCGENLWYLQDLLPMR